MKTSSPRSRTELARILSARGESFSDLAAKCGLNIRTVYNLANGGNKTRSGRAAVECALGVTIWPRSGVQEDSQKRNPKTNSATHVASSALAASSSRAV